MARASASSQACHDRIGVGGTHDKVIFGHNIALLIPHDKERVIAAARAPRLDCRIAWVTGYGTDHPGTFVREIPRAGMQLGAARSKTRIGMQMSGLPLGVARRTRGRRLPI